MRSRAMREGSVGLLILLGLGLFGIFALWLRGVQFGNRSYQAAIEFENAIGLQIGTPVRYRGVNVGKVVAIKPGLNRVDVMVQITSADLKISRDAIIEVNQSGFIGSSSIDITPNSDVPSTAVSANPLDKDCPQDLIICHNSRLRGVKGVVMEDFMRVGIKMADLYSDPELFASIKSIAENTAVASGEATKLTRDLSDLARTVKKELEDLSQYMRQDVGGLTQLMRNEVGGLSESLRGEIGGVSQSLRGEIGGLSETLRGEIGGLTNSLEREIEVISDELVSVSETTKESAREVSTAAIASANSVREAADRIALTAEQVNALLDNNSSTIVTTLNNINQTTEELRLAMANLSPIINDVDRGKLVENLETVSENAVETSANLRNISRQLSDPNKLSQIEDTLVSVRATLDNVEKITTDIDDLTGDDNFRNNLKNLVNGLGDLFSSTQELDQQVRSARNLELLLEEIENAEAREFSRDN